jgi:hypothetical protein
MANYFAAYWFTSVHKFEVENYSIYFVYSFDAGELYSKSFSCTSLIRHHATKIYGDWSYRSIKVSGQLHAPATLPPRKETRSLYIGGWVNPRAGLDDVG